MACLLQDVKRGALALGFGLATCCMARSSQSREASSAHSCGGGGVVVLLRGVGVGRGTQLEG